VWVAEQLVDHRELEVVALNLLVGLVALGLRATGLLGLRSKAVTQESMRALVGAVSMVAVAVEIAQPLPTLVVLVALGLPGEPLLSLIKA